MLPEMRETVCKGDLENIKELVKGYPIHLASHEMNTAGLTVEEIRRRFINHKDDDGNTCLHLAIHHNHLDVLRYLVSLDNLDSNIENKSYKTPLVMAVENRNIKAISVLLASDSIDVNLRDKESNTALIIAAKLGFIDVCDLLFTNPTTEILKKDTNGKNVLEHLYETQQLANLADTSIDKIKKICRGFTPTAPTTWRPAGAAIVTTITELEEIVLKEMMNILANNQSKLIFPKAPEKLAEMIAHKMASGEFKEGTFTSFIEKITTQQKDEGLVNNTGS